ncbi:MAG TPA: O-antigen ligase family protein [Streptosporangiaceae bacterium]|nr:O-antigen ligase family protein [Streptosporangiaceae bacterium]
MTALAIDQPQGLRTPRNHAVLLVQVFAATVMIFPSDFVFKAVGAGGYVAALVSYFLLLAWITATIFGLHDPFERRSPVRMAICALWISSLLSYALMNRGLLTAEQQAAADRWLIQVAGVSGVILVASECLITMEDVRRVLRVLCWGGAFCGVVAALQFKFAYDVTPYIKDVLPGFSVNEAATANTGIGSRGSFNRVPGTAIDPIELGASASMLLPLAVYMAMHDAARPAWRRWLPVLCIAVCIPASVSRSAFLGVAVAMGVFIACMRPAQRLASMGAGVLAVAAIFMTAHGLLGTLRDYFEAGTDDPSIAHRVNNYGYVESLVRQAPWFGQGGGTYIPDALHILDNQYLTSTIELGLVGLAALSFFFLWPAIAALVARARTADPEIRDLCAALAGAALAATVCSVTFDSLTFPMFVNVQALVVGLIGAVWLIVGQASSVPSAADLPQDRINRSVIPRLSVAPEPAREN